MPVARNSILVSGELVTSATSAAPSALPRGRQERSAGSVYLRNEFIMIGQVGPAVNAAVGPVAGGQIRLKSLGSRHLHHWRR